MFGTVYMATDSCLHGNGCIITIADKFMVIILEWVLSNSRHVVNAPYMSIIRMHE